MASELSFGFIGLLIGILSVGVALAWLIAADLANLRADLCERTGFLDTRIGMLETRIKRVFAHVFKPAHAPRIVPMPPIA